MLQRFELVAELVEFLEGHGGFRLQMGWREKDTKARSLATLLGEAGVNLSCAAASTCGQCLSERAVGNNDRQYPGRLVALIHCYIVYLEMVLWDTPRGHKAFKLTTEFASASKVLAANQGLYNGFSPPA